jgi:hypothetical protein
MVPSVKTFGLRIPARRRVTAGEGGAVDSYGGSGAGSETRGSAPADSERAFGADKSGPAWDSMSDGVQETLLRPDPGQENSELM